MTGDPSADARQPETDSAERTRWTESRPTASRRSVVRTGALAVGGIALGLLGSGSATGDAGRDATRRGATNRDAADRDTASQDAPDRTARMYVGDFHPGARFRVVSESIDYEPETPVQEGEAFLADLYWNGYDTRIVAYANTGERALFFPPLDPGVETGAAYRTGWIRSTDELPDGIVTVGFRSVGDSG